MWTKCRVWSKTRSVTASGRVALTARLKDVAISSGDDDNNTRYCLKRYEGNVIGNLRKSGPHTDTSSEDHMKKSLRTGRNSRIGMAEPVQLNVDSRKFAVNRATLRRRAATSRRWPNQRAGAVRRLQLYRRVSLLPNAWTILHGVRRHILSTFFENLTI